MTTITDKYARQAKPKQLQNEKQKEKQEIEEKKRDLMNVQSNCAATINTADQCSRPCVFGYVGTHKLNQNGIKHLEWKGNIFAHNGVTTHCKNQITNAK